jgi:hypothetical protein
MKKVTTLFYAFVFIFLGTMSTQAQGVFISEYIEGSSNNKALELYNATGDTVDLSLYRLYRANNGSTDWQDTLSLEGELLINGVFVIANPSADEAILSVADTTDAITFYNGDDAIALAVNNEGTWEIIDHFGEFGTDPGSAWDVAGVTEATNEQTLVRKANVFSGNATALASFGTDAETSEWIVNDANDFSNLGMHVNGYDITFQADMSGFIDSAAFVPGEDFVTIPGSINGWDTAADTLTDADGDNIYTKTLTLPEGDYAYKFHLYTSKITGGYETGDNRLFTVSMDDTLAAAEPNIEYSDLSDAIIAAVDLNFSANMSVQLLGEFDPETDVLTVSGGFNGWDTSADTLTPSRDAELYQTVVSLTEQAVPATFYYKFTIRTGETVTWESPSIQPLDGDGNRRIRVTEDSYVEGEDKYIVNNDYDGEAPFWSDVTDEDIFTETTDVTFEVDLRPAYYMIADSGALPPSVAAAFEVETIADVAGNGPLLAGGWEDWGPTLTEVEGVLFNDAGESGDVTAGDSVFTLQKTYAPGTARLGTFKLSVGGYDNEGGTGADHNVRIGDDNNVSLIFGAVVRADSVYDNFYDEYILATSQGPTVVRRGGSGDNGVIVSNETEELLDAPEKFQLSQNYPNPFNPSTNINFTLPQTNNVTLTVYNILGQQVTQLVNGRLSAGQHSVKFDASNLSSGMYLYRIEAGTFTQNKKMMLIK